jgi:hypothetical protein
VAAPAEGSFWRRSRLMHKVEDRFSFLFDPEYIDIGIVFM